MKVISFQLVKYSATSSTIIGIRLTCLTDQGHHFTLLASGYDSSFYCQQMRDSGVVELEPTV